MEQLNLFEQKTDVNFYTKLTCKICKSEFKKDAGDFLMELDQEQNICPRCKRIAELRRTPHTFWNDPGHGWLEVRRSDLKLLGIEKEISGYSYQDNKGLDGAAYLEEDCDAGKYIRALWPGEMINGAEFQQFRTSYMIDKYQENIFVRKLRHYSPSK